MKICIVGNGGREHALQRKFDRDGHNVVVTPSRAGIPGSIDTHPEQLDADLFVIGPEGPLVDGLADRLREQGKLVYGPGAGDARLEGSKIWMKKLLSRAGVPTANYVSVYPGEKAAAEVEYFCRYAVSTWGSWVVKTDYLAAGKGVLVTRDIDEAIADAQEKLELGSIVIEEALDGEEVSFFAVCSGTSWVLLPTARDYKRQLDGNEGPNTGGMGSVLPVPGSPSLEDIAPIINAVLCELDDFRGTLFGGLMITNDGIKVLEFNIRFGDPEIQSIASVIDADLALLLADAANGKDLPGTELGITGASVTVVLASDGYPENPIKGDVITGISEANAIDGVTVFHAGTGMDDEGNFITAGGRVLNVTGTAQTVAEARELAYCGARAIRWRGMQFRKDIAASI